MPTNNAINLLPFTQINIQRITAPGAFTYTPTSNLLFAKVTLVGGGGGGGGTQGGVNAACSGGGASGSLVQFILTAVQIGASLNGTVGAVGTGGAAGGVNTGTAGGNTTLSTSSMWTASGGLGGIGGATITSGNTFNAGGAAVINIVGTGLLLLNVIGQSGSFGILSLGNTANAGDGGSNMIASGGIGRAASVSSVVATPGQNATGNGGGGAGALNITFAGGSAGGNGSAGIAIFEEYITL